MHLLVLGHQQAQNTVAPQGDELDVPEEHPLGPGAQDQGRVSRGRGQGPGGLAKELLGIHRRRGKGLLDLPLHAFAQVLMGRIRST